MTRVHSELDLPKEEGKVKVMLAATTCHTWDTRSCSPKVLPKQGAGGSLTQLTQAGESSSAHATTCMFLRADRYFAISAAYTLSSCMNTAA